MRVTATGGSPSLILYFFEGRLAALFTSQAKSLGSMVTVALTRTPSVFRHAPSSSESGVTVTGRSAFKSGDESGGDEGSGFEAQADRDEGEKDSVADDGHAELGGVLGECDEWRCARGC